MRTIALASSLACAAAAHGQTFFWFLESFENGSNVGSWTFGAPTEVVEPNGGVGWGGAYLRGSGLIAPFPILYTSAASAPPFTGNYRAAGVTSMTVALRILQSGSPITPMRPALILVSFNGTPSDPGDDWCAFSAGNATFEGGTWLFTSVQVPSVQTALPAAWSILRLGPGAPAQPDWNALIQSVDRVAFSFDSPLLSPPAQSWDVGADYIVITNDRVCYPNCDGSTIQPCLNVNDYICFINLFYSGDDRANCDGSTTVPALNVQDWGCFLMKYAAGCSAC